MKSFRYIARDSSGRRREGLKQAVSSNALLGWVREQGLIPVSVVEMSAAVKPARRITHRRRIKSADLASLCWQLTTMVEGGVPLTSALETIAEDIDNLHLQQVLQQVVEKVQKGESFSESISKFPKVFNQLFCTMILAGETGGRLSTVLRRLAEYFDERDKLSKKVRSAVAYPVFVFSFITLIVIFIMAFIVPRFRTMFEQMGAELPAFTQVFMGFYDMIRYNLLYILGAVLMLIIFAVLVQSRTKKGHYFFSRMALSIPLLGGIFRQAFLAMFCRTTSTLLAAGVSVLEVFEILSSMTGNDIIKKAIEGTREHIVVGSNISLSMAAAGFFPNLMVKMIQVGEESGSLSEVLNRTSSYYERRVDTTITTVIGLLEPIMIVTVGAVVLVVVLALYLPIFTMSNIPG